MDGWRPLPTALLPRKWVPRPPKAPPKSDLGKARKAALLNRGRHPRVSRTAGEREEARERREQQVHARRHTVPQEARPATPSPVPESPAGKQRHCAQHWRGEAERNRPQKGPT